MNDNANVGVMREARDLWPVPIEWSNHEPLINFAVCAYCSPDLGKSHESLSER